MSPPPTAADALEAALIILARVPRERDDLESNLRATQARCTELAEDARRARRELGCRGGANDSGAKGGGTSWAHGPLAMAYAQ